MINAFVKEKKISREIKKISLTESLALINRQLITKVRF